MNPNIVFEYLDKLTDENAMYVEFRDGGKLLIDNTDIIRTDGYLMEIKSTFGYYITDSSNISGLRILKRADIMAKAVIENIINAEGDE